MYLKFINFQPPLVKWNMQLFSINEKIILMYSSFRAHKTNVSHLILSVLVKTSVSDSYQFYMDSAFLIKNMF